MSSRRGFPTTGWLVALLGWLTSLSALSEGYWESRLWRTFAAEQIPAALAFDTSGRVVLCAGGPRTFVGGVDAETLTLSPERPHSMLNRMSAGRSNWSTRVPVAESNRWGGWISTALD